MRSPSFPATKLSVEFLKELFYLRPHPSSPGLVSAITNHHLSVLGVLAKKLNATESNITVVRVVEALLQDRGQLHRALLELEEQVAALRKEPSNKDWALREFDRKRSALDEKLRGNMRNIEIKLQEIVTALTRSDEAETAYLH
ncbi:MAG: hypothetical protein QY326_03790 [Bdellovibrionota bacterium]|nr:MAG: hypothetical protein QY326_03790 [Bdellovibrionota bacterium]